MQSRGGSNGSRPPNPFPRGYPILCTRGGCERGAEYKVAARWSDGITSELKTYGLTCEACLPVVFAAARAKEAACVRAPEEILEPPGIYRLPLGLPGATLARLIPLEQALVSKLASQGVASAESRAAETQAATSRTD